MRSNNVRFTTIVATAMLWIVPLTVSAQTCTDVGNGGGERVDPVVYKSDGGCEALEGMWVKTYTSYLLHAYAEAYGGCEFHAWDCSHLPCICVTTGSENRGVAGVGITETNSNPMSPFALGTIYPKTAHPQQMDSRWPGTTTPAGVSWSPYTPGTSTLKWNESIFVTRCNIQPSMNYNQRQVNVVNCLPRFKRNSFSNILHLTNGTTYVHIADLGSLGDAIRLAIADINALGLPVTLVETPNVCAGPHCINVGTGDVPPNSCAGSVIGADQDGTVLSSTVTFPTSALGWNQNFNRRTADHEFLHHLGLDEQQNCSTSYSQMAPTPCNATSGYPTSPTINDSLPPQKTTYGGGPATSCPAVQ